LDSLPWSPSIAPHTDTIMSRRPGLSMPKQPLHPNRANAILPHAAYPRPASGRASVSSSPSAASAGLSTSSTKCPRSPSPSSPPSPFRASPTSFLISASPVRTDECQDASDSSSTWRSLLLLSSSPPPPEPSPPPGPPELSTPAAASFFPGHSAIPVTFAHDTAPSGYRFACS
jgi:hypothetical protein